MSGTPVRTVALLAILTTGVTGLTAVGQDATAPRRQPVPQTPFPTPSPYRVAWELDFEHSEPKRVVVQAPGEPNAQAYWYITYKVTNNTEQERTFLPVFEMLTEDGKVQRSDQNIPPAVFEQIKNREKNQFLTPQHQIGGQLRIGEDQAKDGMAIWREPMPEMGRFSIFVTGLSGETATTKVGEKEFRLRKTRKLDYLVRGDDIEPDRDELTPEGKEWVMR